MRRFQALVARTSSLRGKARLQSSQSQTLSKKSSPTPPRPTFPSRADAAALTRRYKSTSTGGHATDTIGEKCFAIMTRERKMIGSISTVCGHTASILTVSAYMMTDILTLRCLAIAAGIFVSSFQYFRPQPLWLPLKWNALLMSINVCMVANILIDRHAAENMPSDMKRLYDDGKFDDRGFSTVQFKKLFDNGHRRMLSQEVICQENREMDKLYYMIDGSATVTISKDGRKLATITSHTFIGEMAFLEYFQNPKNKKEKSFAKASANVFANGLVQVWEWDARRLAHVFKEDRDLSNAFMTYCSHDLRMKLLLQTNASKE